MDLTEQRKHKRLPLKLDICWRRVDSPQGQLNSGRTVNVSTGGLYFETQSSDALQADSLIRVELSVPPTAGSMHYGGRLSGFARVLRTKQQVGSICGSQHGIALEFCHPLKLSS